MPFLFTSSSQFFSVAYCNRWLLIGGVRIDYFANKQQFVMHDSFSITLNKHMAPFFFASVGTLAQNVEAVFLLFVHYCM